MLYIVDKDSFTGCIVARMSDDKYINGTALKFETYKHQKQLPGLITVTLEEFERMREEYILSLQTVFKEIQQAEYYNLVNTLKIKRHSLNQNFAFFFLESDESAFNVYTLCVRYDNKYYCAQKDKNLTEEEIRSLIDYRKQLFVFDVESASHSVELFNYLEDNDISDIFDLFDSNPDKIKLNGTDFPFASVADKNNRYIVYIDIEYNIDRKELEKILLRFFSENILGFFESKYSQWDEYKEKCIAYRDGKGTKYSIWQYRF
ncbi:hypothetical protein [Dysgonomonas sp. ZJ279]|uniref:hypothetical protein n=1 Tax=Dysgonomonas sp. ZJ279 TaxID=2709796 RepID=UPI0013EAE7D5|nr:hypothetical protein [Dysgonomonas sp. ZJ279]